MNFANSMWLSFSSDAWNNSWRSLSSISWWFPIVAWLNLIHRKLSAANSCFMAEFHAAFSSGLFFKRPHLVFFVWLFIGENLKKRLKGLSRRKALTDLVVSCSCFDAQNNSICICWNRQRSPFRWFSKNILIIFSSFMWRQNYCPLKVGWAWLTNSIDRCTWDETPAQRSKPLVTHTRYNF